MKNISEINFDGTILKVNGIITKVLGMGVFNVKLQTLIPKLNEIVIVATVSGKMRIRFINLSLGNEVTVLIDSRYGLNKGRIVYRNKR